MTPDRTSRTRVRLVPLDDSHARPRVDLLARNREHLEPWEPVRADAWFTVAGQRAWITAQGAQRANGRAMRWQVELDGELVGDIGLSNVVRGVFHSANLGYWVDVDHQGQGIATAAVGLAVEQAFGPLGLHRVEAGTLLHNVGSQAALERNGFTRIGIAPAYLRIAGSWQDHLLFQRTFDGWRPSD